ncbi:waprin-Thr1 [Diaphorina citri]|uniref:Waprin-Thr1 n=1 Tax=Diaphorina citri TaxID=121845 RepID=A0A1S3DI78_DIACI|nr:waprin-Thr1 [Diaphorina citri]
MKLFQFCAAFLVLMVLCCDAFPSKFGNCPMASTVKTCTPKCYSDYECSGNKRCCPNYCGWKSCSDTSPVAHDKGPSEKVVYCENVKCQPKQICKFDPKTKRSKCAYP